MILTDVGVRERNGRGNLKKMMKRKLQIAIILTLSLVWLILPQGLCLGATYYLDAVNGIDGNPGTSAAPWKTIAKALSMVSNGDTVKLYSGNYGELKIGNPSYSDWVTFEAVDGHSPIFTNINIYRYPNEGNVYLRFNGITVQSPTVIESTVSFSRCHNIELRNLKVIGYGYATGLGYDAATDWKHGIHLRNSDHILIDGCEIYGVGPGIQTGSDGGQSGELYKKGFLFGIYAVGSNPCNDVTVTNCEIYSCDKAIRLAGSNWRVTNNNCHHSTTDGIVAGACNIAGEGTTLIAYNHVHELGHWEEYSGHNDFIQQNHVQSNNLIIRGNYCHGSDQQGFFLRPDDTKSNTNWLIESNLVYDTNREEKASSTVRVYSVNGVTIRNNTVDGMIMTENESGEMRVTSLCGNIAYRIDLYTDDCPNGNTVVDYEDYNIIHSRWVHMKGHSLGSNSCILGSDATYKYQFVDYNNNDFSLAADSLAIDFCPLVTAPATDLEGNTRVDIPSIGNDGTDYADAGCYEYVLAQDELADKPDKTKLECYNNVFNPTKGEKALIWVELSKPARVKVDLYNTRGNKIRELADEEKDADVYQYYWNGKDDSGNVVGSGLYFVHIQVGDYKKIKKIVVVK